MAWGLETVTDGPAPEALRGPGFHRFIIGAGSQIIQQSFVDIIKAAIGHDQDEVSRPGGE